MPIDDRTPQWHHQVVLTEREEITIDGVANLGSFDDREVLMETELGMLVIRGEGLNIKHLNLEKGNVVIEGMVNSLVYDDETKSKRGLLGRLLR